MEFLWLLPNLVFDLIFDLLFGKVCSVTGQVILDAARSDQDGSAIADNAVQQGEPKRADKGPFLTGMVGLAFWCVVAAGLYLLCAI